mmetsp:Transcript_12310/g.29883  ORF Transcript_12310/g.29883 Transcript_12310/m.29883 type:complete len:336 (-) Transcript_12310:551-1558(-)|eukprot:CAMPEP_0178992332 /NCGR_PEP_ID=MMETSP0795-20121207/6051_1 /TAXON_ID=88552 /ORGANISM="Amoebophrya sp., Strain Ameob2" /LENGTH=335 /DNA_ID=CAMNT_0020684193 /DNA_START=535 /DNA_END=1542 /DNA_ORIENTATION=-
MGDEVPQQLLFENVSPATRLLEKRRQMYEVQDALEAQKTRFAQEEEAFQKKEVQLRAKDLQLQQQLIKFNKFLQDNEAKRRRAETRASEEQAQILQKDEEITSLQKRLDESQNLCLELEEDVLKNLKYEEFLELVKENSDDYSEIQDLVTRYETLEAAHQDLIQSQQKAESGMEAVRNEYQNYRKAKGMEVLALTNKTAALQAELEEVEKRCLQLEASAEHSRQEEAQQSLFLGQIILSVDNLFQRCNLKRPAIQHANELGEKASAIAEIQNADSYAPKVGYAVKQLHVIKAYIKDLRDIQDQIRKEGRGRKQQVVTEFQTKIADPEFVFERVAK